MGNKASRIVIPIPDQGFDPSEVAIPWKMLKSQSVDITFATESGRPGSADPRMVFGKNLGLLAPALKASSEARVAYQFMIRSEAFQKPCRWTDLSASDFDGIILPGGHAKEMRPYLESKVLQNLVIDFFNTDKLVAAICHGVILAARSSEGEKSILWGRKTTALLKSQELTAWASTVLWLGSYYRTYPETVENEVQRKLKSPSDFIQGPPPLLRDSPEAMNRGFAVVDKNYISARWPGDAHKFSHEIIKYLNS
jgi:protease I